MMDNHPQLTIANDTHFITRAVKKTLRGESDPDLTPELVDRVRAYRRFARMGLDEADVGEATKGCWTYSQFVSKNRTLPQLLGKQSLPTDHPMETLLQTLNQD